MQKMKIKQRIIAITLCIAMFFGIIHLENFIDNDISAIDTESTNEEDFSSTYEEIEKEILNRYEETNHSENLVVENFTWRETTEKRCLYYSEYTISQIGKRFMGETIDEIVQISKDPSVEFDEENFFNDTVFEGLTVEDLLYLQEEGYELQELIQEIVKNKKHHVVEYLYGISMFGSTAGGYGKISYNKGITGERTGEYLVMIPSLNRGFYRDPKPFWFIQVNEQAAFCLDLGKHMTEGYMFTLKPDAVSHDKAKLYINAALKYYNEQLALLNGQLNTDLEGVLLPQQIIRIQKQYDKDVEKLYSIVQVYVWSIMAAYELVEKVPSSSLKCSECTNQFVDGDVYCQGADGLYYHCTCNPAGIPKVYYKSKKCDGGACDEVLEYGESWYQDITFFDKYCRRCDLQGRKTPIDNNSVFYYHNSQSDPANGIYYDLWNNHIFCERCYYALTDGKYDYTYGDPYLPDEFRYKYEELDETVRFNEFMVKRINVYCKDCANKSVDTIFYDTFSQYQTCIDIIESTGDLEAIKKEKPIDVIRKACNTNNNFSESFRDIVNILRDYRLEEDLKEANIFYYNSNYQRLATYAEDNHYEPDPDKDSSYSSFNDFTSKMYLIHNITGNINQSTGKGVIASWEKEKLANNPYNFRNDYNIHQNYCGSDYNPKEITDGYVFDFNEADFVSDEECKRIIKEAMNDQYMQSNYKIKISDVEQYTYYTYDELDTTYQHYKYIVTVTTFDDQAHETGKEHIIYEPLVRNYQLKINYQGGWVDGFSTTDKLGVFQNRATSFNVTHKNNKTSNETSTQTTNVAFNTMYIKNAFQFHTSTNANPYVASSLSEERDTGVWKYTHAKNIGVTERIEFTYDGYYAVYLPTPKRTGYNFLYYTDSKGNIVTPKTLNIDGVNYDVYIFDDTKKDTLYKEESDLLYSYELYANWELITKDEDITVHWLDNSNNYTTRPEAIYVELWRYTSTGDAEVCEGYITEKLNTTTADWIARFSNETGITSDGNPTGGYKTNGIFDPNQKIYNYSNNTTSNNVNNNIFAGNGTYLLKISGNNLVPAGSNTWTVTLKDLQKFDTYDPGWKEYTYVVKAITVESLDQTVQYFTSSNKNYNNYNFSMDKYYMTKEINNNPYLKAESNQGTYAQYNSLSIKNYFTKTIVNRAANVAGPTSWKDVSVNILFKDGPQNEVISETNSYDDDIYHFRPYELKVELYQNYAYGIDTDTNTYLSNTGVRVLYKTQSVTHNKNNPWSSLPTGNQSGIVSETISKNGILANELQVTFKNVPTLQDNTCIKIGYDAILTHGSTKYRYTIDNDDVNNNLSDEFSSSHYYANKHQNITTTVTDLDYTKLYSASLNKYLEVVDTIYKEITASQYNALSTEYKDYSYTYYDNGIIKYYTPDFSKIDTNKYIYKAQVYKYISSKGYDYVSLTSQDYTIYQDYLRQEDDTMLVLGQNNVYDKYTGGEFGPGTKKYTEKYKSMAYNLRYYYINEERYMNAAVSFAVDQFLAPEKKTEYLLYKETLYWNFTLTLNHANTPLPEEYSGSNSEDDRTGNYNGTSNDDFTHTNNKITITNTIYNDKNHTTNVTLDNYNNLIINPEHEDFLITFKQVEKIWNNSGHNVTESYNNNKYSINGYMYVNNTSSGTKVTYKSNTAPITNSIDMGNDYNILVPANGTVVMDYLPDGKYEITCHYDIDFDSFDFAFSGSKGTAKFTEENGKHYLTLSSVDVKTEGTIKHMATIDYWRGYVDDENNNANSANNTISNLNYKSSMN